MVAPGFAVPADEAQVYTEHWGRRSITHYKEYGQPCPTLLTRSHKWAVSVALNTPAMPVVNQFRSYVYRD